MIRMANYQEIATIGLGSVVYYPKGEELLLVVGVVPQRSQVFATKIYNYGTDEEFLSPNSAGTAFLSWINPVEDHWSVDRIKAASRKGAKRFYDDGSILFKVNEGHLEKIALSAETPPLTIRRFRSDRDIITDWVFDDPID